MIKNLEFIEKNFSKRPKKDLELEKSAEIITQEKSGSSKKNINHSGELLELEKK